MYHMSLRNFILILTSIILLTACNQKDEPAVTEAADTFAQAVSLYEQGKLDEAKTLLEQGIQADPTNGMYDFYLGNIYRRNNDVSKAVVHYQNAIHKSPKMMEAYNNLVGLQMVTNQFDQALETADKGLKEQPDFDELKFKKAQILYVKEQYNDSIAILNELVRNPSYFEAHRFLGLNYIKQNNNAKALEHLKVYLQQAPEGVPFKEEVKKLIQEIEKK